MELQNPEDFRYDQYFSDIEDYNNELICLYNELYAALRYFRWNTITIEEYYSGKAFIIYDDQDESIKVVDPTGGIVHNDDGSITLNTNIRELSIKIKSSVDTFFQNIQE